MKFNPGFVIGEVVSNREVSKAFGCAIMGGMRPSTKAGTLVLISDMTKPFYKDEWKNGILHYTGMGKYGDQTLKGNNILNCMSPMLMVLNFTFLRYMRKQNILIKGL